MKRSNVVLCAVLATGLLASATQAKDSVKERLQKVEDRLAIEHLVVGEYPKALDSANWKDYAATFTEDGELQQGTQITKTRKAIEEQFSRPRTPRPRPADAAGGSAPAAPAAGGAAAPAARPVSKHVVTNLNYTINGDTATGTAYWQTVSTRDGKTTIAGAGHYNDVIKKVNGKWLFQHREIVNPLRDARAAAGPAPTATP
jgi:hypothetical protein